MRVWPETGEKATTLAEEPLVDTEQRLRSHARLWRGLASGVMVLGLAAAYTLAQDAAHQPTGPLGAEEFDFWLFASIMGAAVLGLGLSLGVFFMLSDMMEGMAELIGRAGAKEDAMTSAVTPVSALQGMTFVPTHQVPAGGLAARSTPDPTAKPIGRLKEGWPLRVDEVLGSWAGVTGPKGQSCWVNAPSLVPVSESSGSEAQPDSTASPRDDAAHGLAAPAAPGVQELGGQL